MTKRQKLINRHSKSITRGEVSKKIVSNPDLDSNILPGEISILLTKGNEGIYTLNHDGTSIIEYLPFIDTKKYVDNQISNIPDKHQIFVDDTGGNKLLKTNAELVIVTSLSQVIYSGIDNGTVSCCQFLNHTSNDIYFTFNDANAGSGKFVGNGILKTLALPSKGTVEFIKHVDGWYMSKLFGLTYYPDLVDSGRTGNYVIGIKNDGLGVIEEVIDMKAWDETIVEELDSNRLNELYPGVPVGFQLVCPSINSIYEKINSLNMWMRIMLNSIDSVVYEQDR